MSVGLFYFLVFIGEEFGVLYILFVGIFEGLKVIDLRFFFFIVFWKVGNIFRAK